MPELKSISFSKSTLPECFSGTHKEIANAKFGKTVSQVVLGCAVILSVALAILIGMVFHNSSLLTNHFIAIKGSMMAIGLGSFALYGAGMLAFAVNAYILKNSNRILTKAGLTDIYHQEITEALKDNNTTRQEQLKTFFLSIPYNASLQDTNA